MKWYLLSLIMVMGFVACHREEPLEPPYDDNSVVIVSDRDYTPYLLSSFGESQDYIHITMYLMKYYPDDSSNGVSQLQKALVSAKNRGVDVRVILEWSDYNNSLNENNESTYVYLDSMGIDVKFDPVGVTTHAKFAVIDDKVAFAGSSNWTKSAIEDNHEMNIKLQNSDVVKDMESYFQDLWAVSNYRIK